MLFKIKSIQLLFFCFCSLVASAQSIEVISQDDNPLQVSPLLGAYVNINLQYSSQSGATANHIYVGLEVLDANNNFVRTVSGETLRDVQAGNNINRNVSLFVGSINPISTELPTGQYYQVIARLYTLTWTELASAGYWNTSALTVEQSTYTFSNKSIAKGADISWMTEMESDGFTWKDNDGNLKELMPLLKEYDIDAVRLRVWVNPDISGANGWCDIDDMVAKAEKAKVNNLDIMLTIHYSDWWADPGKQTKPAAWTNFSVSQLENAVANHTLDILNALKVKNITPKWIQIGNETNDGMLWSTGRASTGGFSNYAKFLNAGANAVKNFDSNIKTIIHIAGGNNNSLMRWNIDGLLNNGFQFNKFDIIAMSSYPDATDWKQQVDDTYANMVDLKARYNKDVMMAEVGFSNSQPDFSYQYLTYMIERTKEADGLGVFYWEPIAHKGWKSYGKGAWDEDGSPSDAMDAFIDKSTLNTAAFNVQQPIVKLFPNPSSKFIFIESKHIDLKDYEILNITGQLIRKGSFNSSANQNSINIDNLSKGLYLVKINSKIVRKIFKN